MVFGFKRDGDADRLDRIEATLLRMTKDDRHTFELAMSAVLDGVDPHSIRAEIRATDHKVNEAEREIRRELVIHAGVHGGIDTPAILVYMSIVKDIERVGDYSKNLFDIAADGVVITDGPDAERFRQLREEIASTITEVGDVFHVRDQERARAMLSRGDRLLKSFDDRVSELVRGEDQSNHAIAVALAYRYFKRIVAHLMNVLSAVVMPVDRIDYFDEDPEDR